MPPNSLESLYGFFVSSRMYSVLLPLLCSPAWLTHKKKNPVCSKGGDFSSFLRSSSLFIFTFRRNEELLIRNSWRLASVVAAVTSLVGVRVVANFFTSSFFSVPEKEIETFFATCLLPFLFFSCGFTRCFGIGTVSHLSQKGSFE